MKLFYGADPANFDPADEVELDILRTLKMQRRAVYDDSGQDVLYTEVEIEVIAAVNPAATSYAGEVGVQPVRRAGQRAVATDRAIRHKLMEPRRVLRFVSDEVGEAAVSRVLLQSPAPTLADPPYTCDVRGGPYPEDFDVIAFWGVPKTMIVYYRIKTCINECHQEDGHPVVSHRWSQTSDTDADHFSTRITEGVIHFDVAELVRRGFIPDQFRQDIAVPVPRNFQREHARVLVTPDGTQLRYTLVDREKSHLFSNNVRATRIEAYHTERALQPSIDAAISHIAVAGARGAVNLLHAQIQGTVIGLPAAVAAGLAAGAAIDLEAAMMTAPSFETSVFVRIWGDRQSLRSDLALLAMSVAFARILNPRFLRNFPSEDTMLTRDLNGKFVEFQYKIQHPPSLTSLIGGVPDVLSNDQEFIQGAGGRIDPADGDSNPRFPNAGESRGTWVGKLFAQELDAACSNPDTPPIVSLSVQDLNDAELSGQDF